LLNGTDSLHSEVSELFVRKL